MLIFDEIKERLQYSPSDRIYTEDDGAYFYIPTIEYQSLIDLLAEMNDRIEDLETKLREIESYEQEQHEAFSNT